VRRRTHPLAPAGLPIWVALFSLVSAGVRADLAPAPQGAIVGFLTRYGAGDQAGPVAALASVKDVSVYVRMFQQDGPVWVAGAAGPDDAAWRRFVMASLIVEVVEARLQEDWADLRDLLEWACALIRTDPPGPRELVWQRAALAVIEGAYDARFLMAPPPPPQGRGQGQAPSGPVMFDHAAHVRARFPDESRFGLAQAFVLETRAPREPLIVGPNPSGTRTATRAAERARLLTLEAISALEPWLDDPEVGAEARLRTGYLRFRGGDAAGALEAFDQAARADDPFVRYLAFFLAGRIHDRQGAPEPADAAYRHALEVLPGAQSAAIALSARLFLDDRPDEAYAVVDAAARVTPVPIDPWRVYGYGEFRRWPVLVRELRALVVRSGRTR
jgi:tetratricopeptide (TPR) repeat protein